MTILPEKITIGSRQSPLAKKQVEIFVQKFKEIYGKNISSILDFKYLKTSGDKLLDKNISKFGNKGLFTKELDEAQLKNQIDVSIHSLKDLPTRINDKLCISLLFCKPILDILFCLNKCIDFWSSDEDCSEVWRNISCRYP